MTMALFFLDSHCLASASAKLVPCCSAWLCRCSGESEGDSSRRAISLGPAMIHCYRDDMDFLNDTGRKSYTHIGCHDVEGTYLDGGYSRR